MTVSQNILNAISRAQSARIMLTGRPTEQQARRARSMLAEARKELTTAMSGASVAVSEAKERDGVEAQDRAISARSAERRGEWFATAVEVCL